MQASAHEAFPKKMDKKSVFFYHIAHSRYLFSIYLDPTLMKSTLKNILFSVLPCVFFFGFLEASFALFGVRPGACDFVERRILEQKLTKYKAKNEFRIFFYGESTMQGDALYPESTIDGWVRLYLQDLFPARDKKVTLYNFARVGSNSHFIRDSFFETLPYKPDMAVFYTAHNDFVQLDNRHTNFDPQPLKPGQEGYWRDVARNFVKQSAFLSEMNRLNIRLKIERHKRRDARRKGLELPKIETWEKFYNPVYDAIDQESSVFKTILRHWENNVRRIVAAGAKRKISVVFFEGAANYKEYTPNESVHRTGLNAGTLGLWSAYYRLAQKTEADGNFRKAVRFYRKSLELDAEYAEAHHGLGRSYESIGKFALAEKSYKTANDKDRVPLRGPSAVNLFYKKLSSESIPFVSVIPTTEIFEKNSPNGIIDGSMMLDTLHPTVRGQSLMGLEVVKILSQHPAFLKNSWNWENLKPSEEMKKRLNLNEAFHFRVYLQKACFVGRFYDKSIEYSKKALALDPQSAEAKRCLAWAYWRKGDKEKALKIYSELFEFSPQSVHDALQNNADLRKAFLFNRRRLFPSSLPVPHE